MYRSNFYHKQQGYVGILRMPKDIENEVKKYLYKEYKYTKIDEEAKREIMWLIDNYECKVEIVLIYEFFNLNVKQSIEYRIYDKVKNYIEYENGIYIYLEEENIIKVVENAKYILIGSNERKLESIEFLFNGEEVKNKIIWRMKERISKGIIKFINYLNRNPKIYKIIIFFELALLGYEIIKKIFLI